MKQKQERKPDRMDRFIDAANRVEDRCARRFDNFLKTNRFMNHNITNIVFFSLFSLGAAGAVAHQAVKLHHRAPLVDRLESNKVLAEESVEFQVRQVRKERVQCIDQGKSFEACVATEQQRIAQVGEEAVIAKEDLESMRANQRIAKLVVLAYPLVSILCGINALRFALSMRKKETPQPETQGETS